MDHGSQSRSGDQDVGEEFVADDDDNRISKKLARKETKSVIPKLDEQDRQLVLPLIIKIL